MMTVSRFMKCLLSKGMSTIRHFDILVPRKLLRDAPKKFCTEIFEILLKIPTNESFLITG